MVDSVISVNLVFGISLPVSDANVMDTHSFVIKKREIAWIVLILRKDAIATSASKDSMEIH